MKVILATPFTQEGRQNRFRLIAIFWYVLSLTFALSYVAMGLRQAFSGNYTVSDDAREYLPWIYRHFNSGLFPNDLIADYFQSITPIGYAAIYRIIASIGIDIVFFSKILPAVLIVITTSYCFQVSMLLLPVPMAGFIASLLLNQSLCLRDNLFSATPRDFIYPLFLAFLYYLLRNSRNGVLIAIALQALIYPLTAFISLGVLFLRLFHLGDRKNDFLLFAAAVAIAGAAIVPYTIQSGQFGPTIAAEVARTMPEYWRGGRVSYFTDNMFKYWLDGRDSGFLALIAPAQLFIGLLLPIILKYKSFFPKAQQVQDGVRVLPLIIVASSVMFFIAHAVAFKLHWPSRHTNHTFKMVLALAAAIALTLIIDAAMQWSKQRGKQLLVLAGVVLVLAGLIFYPSTLKVFPKTPYIVGEVPALYEYLQKQPQDIRIVSTYEEVDNIPTFAQRSILTGKEYALPFHTKYYAQIRTRMLDLIHAQYSLDIQEVKDFIQKYNVTFWLLKRSAFDPKYVAKNTWLQQYQPAAKQAIANLETSTPVLGNLINSCKVFEAEKFLLLKAECIEGMK